MPRLADFETEPEILYTLHRIGRCGERLGGRRIETETKKLLVKDLVVILVAVGGLLAFYGVVVLVSTIAQIKLP